MSRSSSLSIRGQFHSKHPFEALLRFIKRLGGSVEIDNEIHGSTHGDNMAWFDHPTEGREPFGLASELHKEGRLDSVDCEIPSSDGSLRYYNLSVCNSSVWNGSSLEITFLANRVTLPDGAPDFNWYYEQFVPLARGFMSIDGVEFSDYL